jgi:hypothetical protein
MKIEKKDALKSLWAAIEDTLKALKALSENPVVVSSVSNLWDSFNTYQSNIRALYSTNIILGKFYKMINYDKEFIIFKAEYFDSRSSRDGIGLKVRVLTASSKKINYEVVEDEMTFTLTNLNTLTEMEINPQDLPLHVSNEFIGTLFKELMTEAGLPVPESSPETKEE